MDGIRKKLGVRASKGYPQTGGFTDLQMLFNAEDYADYLLKSQCVKRITEKDQTDMAALERDINRPWRKKRSWRWRAPRRGGPKRDSRGAAAGGGWEDPGDGIRLRRGAGRCSKAGEGSAEDWSRA